jgi:hypothetical protein
MFVGGDRDESYPTSQEELKKKIKVIGISRWNSLTVSKSCECNSILSSTET